MHPAFHRADVVGVGVDDFVVAVGPLQRALDDVAVAFAVGRDDRRERFFVFVEPLDERDDAALVEIRLLFGLFALFDAFVAQRDAQAAIEEREFAQALLERAPREVERLEDLRIGLEPLIRAGAFGGSADLLERHRRDAALELDLVEIAVAAHARRHVFGERVDDRHADAVQAARHLVAALAELAAGVQDRHRDLDRRHLFFGVHVDRNSAPVVVHGNRAVLVDDDVDLGRDAR